MHWQLARGVLTKNYFMLLAGIILTFIAPFIYYSYKYLFLAFIIFIIIYWVVYSLIIKNKFFEVLNKAEKETCHSVTNILRSFKHDFLNHFQVIQSLAELNQYNRLNDYLEVVNSDANKFGRILKIYHPEISLFLLEQTAKYKRNDVDFEISIDTNLEKISCKPENLVLIMERIYNVIDKNQTVEANEAQEITPCRIDWYIKEEEGSYRFEVKLNNYPYLCERVIKELESLKKGYDIRISSEKDRLEIKLYIEKYNMDQK